MVEVSLGLASSSTLVHTTYLKPSRPSSTAHRLLDMHSEFTLTSKQTVCVILEPSVLLIAVYAYTTALQQGPLWKYDLSYKPPQRTGCLCHCSVALQIHLYEAPKPLGNIFRPITLPLSSHCKAIASFPHSKLHMILMGCPDALIVCVRSLPRSHTAAGRQ